MGSSKGPQIHKFAFGRTQRDCESHQGSLNAFGTILRAGKMVLGGQGLISQLVRRDVHVRSALCDKGVFQFGTSKLLAQADEFLLLHLHYKGPLPAKRHTVSRPLHNES